MPEVMFRPRNREAGSILVTVVTAMAILFVLLAGYLSSIMVENRATQRSFLAASALNLAEAGVEEAIWKFNRASTWDDWQTDSLGRRQFTSSLAAGDSKAGDYQVVVTGAQTNEPTIEAVGFVPSFSAPNRVERRVRVLLKRGSQTLFDQALFGHANLRVTGSVYTDSYDSRLGPYGPSNRGAEGDVATNGAATGAVTLIGSVTVNGEAGTGPNGTVSIGSGCRVNGQTSSDIAEFLPDPVVPSPLVSLSTTGPMCVSGNNSRSIGPGDYKYTELDLSGSGQLVIRGPTRLYVLGNQRTSGSSRISVQGRVEVYAGGDVDVSGRGVENTSGLPTDFFLFGTATCTDVRLSGSSVFYGAVYAPHATLTCTGNSDFYGGISAGSCVATGNVGIHYDRALRDVSFEFVPTSYELVAWQDEF